MKKLHYIHRLQPNFKRQQLYGLHQPVLAAKSALEVNLSLRDVQLRGLDPWLLVQHPQSSLICVTATEDLGKVAHGVIFISFL
ncbi:MAG: hypothetical protein SFY66_14010 [Oculatellaceae cyanobacterium bins.114]|nr:hypothetical protein [Oculatellaceae cyanobacterium bins.114]